MVNIPFIKAYRSRGKVYFYYRRNGQSQRIDGEFGSDEWWTSYKAINKSFEDTGHAPGIRPDSLEAVCRLYLKSDAFRVLKDTTKADYLRVIADLRDKLGDAPIKNMTRKVIVQLRDRIAKRHPRKAMRYVTVIKLVIECARDHGLIDGNAAKEIRRPAGYQSEPHRAWTPEQIEIFLAGAAPIWRRALIVLLYTGLRREDALKLKRQHIKDGRIRWTPAKTDRISPEPVVIPIHSALAAELAQPMLVTSLYLIQGTRGGPMDKFRVSHRIRSECLRLGITDPPPLHGLRKNAVRMLRECGCKKEEINAITGQSEAMIALYSKGFDRTRLADAALLKWERVSSGVSNIDED